MEKETVLDIMRSFDGEFVSGEEISERLGVTRAAVWKQIKALQSGGYEIESQTGKGYRLLSSPDVLTEREISRFAEHRDGRKIICFDEIDSTNSYAKKIALDGAEDGTVVIADCQSAGRGRMGRRFVSPSGKGIYITMIMKPTLAPAAAAPMTALGAVAVCGAIERVCGVRPQIKWTNDIIMNNKKICGILTEMGVEAESGQIQYVVMGIGVNVRQSAEDFGTELSAIASSIESETGARISRPNLAGELINALDKLREDVESGSTEKYLEAYRSDCVNIGRTVRIVGAAEGFNAVAVGIDDDFGLIVKKENGETEILRSGEVSVRGLYGYVE